MDFSLCRKTVVRARVGAALRWRLAAVVTAAGLVGVCGAAAASAASAAPARAGSRSLASTDPNVTAQVDRDRAATARLEGRVNHLGLSCAENSELELDLAYVRDALNQGNILGARGLLQASMSEAGALGHDGLLSSSQAARFESDVRPLFRSIPTKGKVNHEFHETSHVPRPVPHACPSGPAQAAGTQATNSVGVAASGVAPAIGNLNDTLRIVLKSAVSHAPVAGEVFTTLVELLWPSEESDNVTWDQMRDYVDQHIAQAIDQQLKEHLDAVLTGLSGVVHNYIVALQDPSDVNFIRENFVATLDHLTAAAPQFAPETRPYLVLPEYTQMHNLLLTQLRDGVLHGASWDIPQKAIVDYAKQFTADRGPADAWLINQSQVALDNVPRPAGGNNYGARLFSAQQNLELTLKPATVDQAYYWWYMDPKRFPGRAEPCPPDKPSLACFLPDTRVLWTPAYGFMPNDGTPTVDKFATNPILTHLTIWGGDRLDAIELTSKREPAGRREGASGGSDRPPDGGSFALGDSPDSRGQITTVYGWYGDVQQGLGFVFTKNGTTTNSGQITKNLPYHPEKPPSYYSISLPGEVLCDAKIMGEFPGPYFSAASTIWGFCYDDNSGG